MYALLITPKADKIFAKLIKKDREAYDTIINKAKELAESDSFSIQHYKNLCAPLAHLKRVHIQKSFVLVFKVDEKNKTITLENYDHHDNIYEK